MGDVVNLLGSGNAMNVSFTYKVQDEAGGITQALVLAEQFVGEEQCVVILGDNVFEEDITLYMKNFLTQGNGAEPQRFGVPELQNDKIISIEEKPQIPKSSFAVTGIYMYDNSVFEIIKTLTPSHRGWLEITDVNNAYIKRNQLTYDVLNGWWTDAGTHASLVRANELAKDILFDEMFGELKL